MKRLFILPVLFLLGGCALMHPTDPYPSTPPQPVAPSENVFPGGRAASSLQAAEKPIRLAEAVAAIGGLSMEILVSLFLMPCLYVAASRTTS